MFLPIRLLSILAGIGGCFLIDLIAHRSLGDYEQRLVVLAGLYVTLAVSLNLINGITGQFSIGHAAFYQIGAYLTGYLSIHYMQHYKASVGGDVPWLVIMVFVGAAGAAVAGLVVGLPSLRLRGDYLAIVTLGFGEIIRIIVQNTEALGGSYALKDIPKIQPIWLTCLLAMTCVAVCRNLLKTARGLTFLAVREDEIAGAAMGVNVTRVKVTAFMIGSAFAGAAGALLAHYETFIAPQTFAMDVSFIILTMVVLGGTGSITGSIVSAMFLSYLPEYLRGLKNADGSNLMVSPATIIAALISVVFAVVAIRTIILKGRGTVWRRTAQYVASIVIAIGLEPIVRIPFNAVTSLADPHIEAGQLRMVIFAVALISIMLIRPQGMFAHHELSWDAISRLFRGRREVAA